MPQHVVVIGAGVIGLSSSLLLLEAGYTVTVLARDLPAPFETLILSAPSHINYTSPWAGAHNRWVPPTSSGEHAREHAFSLRTFARMTALATSTEVGHGITLMKGVEYLEAPPAEYLSLTESRAADLQMPGFRRLSAEEFPDDEIKWACEYDTWCVNPMVYCLFLLRRFTHRGGRVITRELRSLAEVFALTTELGDIHAVVNASGTGLAFDPDVFITRGQTVVVANRCAATVTRQNADGTWTFCVPRNYDGGTVIGGTKEPGNWDATPSAEVRETLLERFAATYPAILGDGEEFKVVADIVGRRPTRKGGPRIEGEVVNGNFVMHAYGLGGRGYELSWGVAEEVVKGVNGHLPSAKL